MKTLAKKKKKSGEKRNRKKQKLLNSGTGANEQKKLFFFFISYIFDKGKENPKLFSQLLSKGKKKKNFDQNL